MDRVLDLASVSPLTRSMILLYHRGHSAAWEDFLFDLKDKLWGPLTGEDLCELGRGARPGDLIVSTRFLDYGHVEACDLYFRLRRTWRHDVLEFVGDLFRCRNKTAEKPWRLLSQITSRRKIKKRPSCRKPPQSFYEFTGEFRAVLRYPDWWAWADLAPGTPDDLAVLDALEATAAASGGGARPAAMISNRRNLHEEGYLFHVRTLNDTLDVRFQDVTEPPSCHPKRFTCGDVNAASLPALLDELRRRRGLTFVARPEQAGPASVLGRLHPACATQLLQMRMELGRQGSDAWQTFLRGLGDKLWGPLTKHDLDELLPTLRETGEAIVSACCRGRHEWESVRVYTASGYFYGLELCVDDGLYHYRRTQGPDPGALLSSVKLKPCPPEHRPLSSADFLTDLDLCLKGPKWWGWKKVRTEWNHDAVDGDYYDDEDNPALCTDQDWVVRALRRSLGPGKPAVLISILGYNIDESYYAYLGHVKTLEDTAPVYFCGYFYYYKELRAVRLSTLLNEMESVLGLKLVDRRPPKLLEAAADNLREQGFDLNQLTEDVCMIVP